MRHARKHNADQEKILMHKLIEVGPTYSYYARSDGCIIRCLNSNYKESAVKPYINRGSAAVKINRKERLVKHIIAEAFIPKYKSEMLIENIDGNIFNCDPNNLRIYTYEEHGKQTGFKSRSIPVTVMTPDGRIEHYRSIRATAKALYCTYVAIYDYINHTYKSSILDGYKFKFGE